MHCLYQAFQAQHSQDNNNTVSVSIHVIVTVRLYILGTVLSYFKLFSPFYLPT